MTAATQYQIWLARDDGTRIALLSDFAASFEYTRVLNGLGYWAVTLPATFDAGLIDIDRRITFWRKPIDGVYQADFSGFVRGHRRQTDDNGNFTRTIYGPHLNGLLDGRNVAYYAGTAQAARSATAADDVMKAIVRYNLGASSLTANGRIISAPLSASYFSVAADTTLAPVLTKAYAWRNVLDVLTELSEASRTAGTELYFDVAATSETGMEFRTYPNQLGRDRTAASAGGLVVGVEFGNLTAPVLDEDWRSEANSGLGLGQGDGAARIIQTYQDTPRYTRSIWGAREIAVAAQNNASSTGVYDAAKSAVVGARSVRSFSGKLVSSPGSQYGKDWGFGDRITVSYDGLQFNALVRAVTVQLDSDGNENITATLEAYL